MISISITAAAFNSITATLPPGSVGFEAEPDANGERLIWLEEGIVDRLAALRRPGESFSDVILRLAESEAGIGLRDLRPPVPGEAEAQQAKGHHHPSRRFRSAIPPSRSPR